jgi:hypothetical protein
LRRPPCPQIISSDKKWDFRADNTANMDGWLAAIKANINMVRRSATVTINPLEQHQQEQARAQSRRDSVSMQEWDRKQGPGHVQEQGPVGDEVGHDFDEHGFDEHDEHLHNELDDDDHDGLHHGDQYGSAVGSGHGGGYDPQYDQQYLHDQQYLQQPAPDF